ncbi:MAG: integrin alpha, partial [Acidimicrobiales bacterium]
MAFGVASGVGAGADTPYDTQRVDAPEPQAKSNWADRVVPVSDLTGDGVNDVFVDSYQNDVYKGPGPACGQPEPNGCQEDAGKVYLVSGADGSIRYDITSPELQAGARFGFFVESPGDVNGDGKDDVVVGAESQDVDAMTGDACKAGQANCNADQGKAYIFSGPTGRLIRTINNPNPQPSARFGSRIARAGDITGDGVSEVIMGASSNDLPAGCGQTTPVPAGCRKDEGEAFIFNGATGDLVRTPNIPAADRAAAPCSTSCGSFGLAVGGPGDTDGDGVPDQLVDAASGGSGVGTNGVGRSYVFSGRTGELLLRINDPVPQPGAFFGCDVVKPLTPGDVNGDGFADLYAYGFQQDGPNG